MAACDTRSYNLQTAPSSDGYMTQPSLNLIPYTSNRSLRASLVPRLELAPNNIITRIRLLLAHVITDADSLYSFPGYEWSGDELRRWRSRKQNRSSSLRLAPRARSRGRGEGLRRWEAGGRGGGRRRWGAMGQGEQLGVRGQGRGLRGWGVRGSEVVGALEGHLRRHRKLLKVLKRRSSVRRKLLAREVAEWFPELPLETVYQ